MTILIPLIASGQETITNQLDDKGLKTGHWVVSDENGKKIYDGNFIAGKPSGIMTRYYSDGSVKAIMDFDSSGFNAYTRIFDQAGSLRAEGNYINQKKNSEWKFYGSNGSVLVRVKYANDSLSGQAVRYYADGKIMEITNWKNNAMNGMQMIFNEDGIKTAEIFYRDNKMEGIYIVYFPGGDTAIKGLFSKNLKEGDWNYYFENGSTDYILNYSGGKLLNPEVLDQRRKEVFEMYEKNKELVKDPLMYFMDPESYFRK